MKTTETSATRSWRKRRQNSCRGERAATSPPTSRKSSAPAARTGRISVPPTLIGRRPCVPTWRSDELAHLCQHRIYTFDGPDGATFHAALPAVHIRSPQGNTQPMDTLFDEDPAAPAASGRPRGARRRRPRPAGGAGAPADARAASSARRTCSARARRCAPRSSRARPHSMLLYGPPGSGKTTLARIVAARLGGGLRGAERRRRRGARRCGR